MSGAIASPQRAAQAERSARTAEFLCSAVREVCATIGVDRRTP